MGNTQEKKKSFKNSEKWRVIKYALIAISAGLIQILSVIILEQGIKLDQKVDLSGLASNKVFAAIFYDVEHKKVYGLSYFIALILSVIWNFTINRKYTFKSANNVPIAMLKVLGYYLIFTPISCYWTTQLNQVWEWKVGDAVLSMYVILIFTMLVNGVTEFLFQRFYVFRDSIDSNAGNKKNEKVEYVADFEAGKYSEKHITDEK